VVGHRAEISRTHEMELSCEQTIRSRGVCEPALEPRGEWEGSQTRGQDFKPDLGNSAVRHYRGAFENVAMVETRTHLAIERAGLVTLHLQLARRSSIPTIDRVEHGGPCSPVRYFLVSRPALSGDRKLFLELMHEAATLRGSPTFRLKCYLAMLPFRSLD
jgi:hypothetical protein